MARASIHLVRAWLCTSDDTWRLETFVYTASFPIRPIRKTGPQQYAPRPSQAGGPAQIERELQLARLQWECSSTRINSRARATSERKPSMLCPLVAYTRVTMAMQVLTASGASTKLRGGPHLYKYQVRRQHGSNRKPSSITIGVDKSETFQLHSHSFFLSFTIHSFC